MLDLGRMCLTIITADVPVLAVVQKALAVILNRDISIMD
jgi:hypothetical protein